MSIESTAVYRLSDGALSVSLEEEAVVLGLGKDRYFGVRGAARHLLEGLRGGMTVEAMVSEFQRRYDVTTEAARRDLETILPKLVAADIVTRVD
ncbi:MAG: PqqD family protein [Brevundimonas sp.]